MCVLNECFKISFAFLERREQYLCIYIYIYYTHLTGFRSNVGKAVLPVWIYPDKTLETYIKTG